MNVWVTLAAAAVTGLTVFASLGGFSKKEEENEVEPLRNSPEEIPDEILDGPLRTKPSGRQREREMRGKTEKNVRDFQESLGKLSSIIGNLAAAVTSIMRIFYEDPYERITPSTIIY